jgi:uncharacterized protein (TIGR02453 family)
MPPAFFTPALFSFLRDLTDNNDRAWFKANQDRYDDHVRQPALDFIEEFATPLLQISKHFVADPRKVGGSLFRIQRDTRFSKDKTPYKTHVGIHFRHVATREDVHGPGFYLQLAPNNCLAAIGLWEPSAPDADAVRRAIVGEPVSWKRAVRAKQFREVYAELEGDSLARPPRGFDAGHPLIEDLKRRDFVASVRLTQKQVTSPDFMATYLATVKAGVPLMRFLSEAVGLAF